MTSFLSLPEFEQNADQIWKSVDQLIDAGKLEMEKIGNQDLTGVSFSSTLGALDDLSFTETLVMNRVHLLQNVSTDETIRKSAQEAYVKYQNWAIERAYDRKVYDVIQAFRQKHEKLSEKEKLSGEENKILEETLRDYKRLGFHLNESEQKVLQDLQKKLSTIETDFSQAINDYEDELWVTREDLKGLAEDFVSSLKKRDNGQLRISLQYPEYLPVMEFCENEDLRRDLLTKKMLTASKTNVARLNEMIALRDEIARMIGYDSWNDYVLEERMAKTPQKVQSFLDQFEAKLKPKSQIELQELKKLKADETSNSEAEIKIWDYAYYSARNKKFKFQVDIQSLKEFFPLETVLQGMFGLVQKLFGLDFEEQKSGNFYRWSDEVRLFKVTSGKNDPIGYFYLDLFPRTGKYGHAAAFGLTPGKLLSSGNYQRPVAAMICNFPPQKPSLLSHNEVETLFHEFGHILHGLLTTAKYTRFSGTSVAWDFVEAPSQVLENWCWDAEVLNMITAPEKKISADLVFRMNQAKKAGMGLFYLRQLSYAKADLAFHGPGRIKDSTKIMNEVVTKTFFANPEGTVPAAGFGHMVGYASGYYGYSWADVMAADIFSIFKANGLLDESTGRKLRKEIYEVGSSRDENASLESFLGRPLSNEAFFRDLGLEAA